MKESFEIEGLQLENFKWLKEEIGEFQGFGGKKRNLVVLDLRWKRESKGS